MCIDMIIKIYIAYASLLFVFVGRSVLVCEWVCELLVYIFLLLVCLLYVKGVQHLSGSFAFSCTSSIYVLYYFGVFYIDGK